MIRISNIFLILLATFGWSHISNAEDVPDRAASGCLVNEMKLEGLYRTDEVWLRDYINLSFPREMTSEDADLVRAHLMTTDIFSNSKVALRRLDKNTCELEVNITEKWTLIPVIRGAYGGGTPLLVVGGYETNTFGRLKLIGVEARRYGNMAPGFFLFAKSQRAWRGSGSYGGELWLDRRRRSFLDSDSKVFGYADSEAWTFKYELLYPLDEKTHGTGALQAGFHLELVRESPTTFSDKDGNENESLKPDDVSVPTIVTSSSLLLPMLAYDHVQQDGMEMSGLRGMIRGGGQMVETKYRGASESEIYWYTKMPASLNLAVHGFAGRQGSDTLRNLYFLGGFDSIRGLPDGVHYGKTITYGNFELRWLAMQTKFLHFQPAVFADHGSAFSEATDALSHRESAVGIGLRFGVPQIYRFLVRVDYGWSVGQTKSRGLSIGLGQFFQPYKLFF